MEPVQGEDQALAQLSGASRQLLVRPVMIGISFGKIWGEGGVACGPFETRDLEDSQCLSSC